MLHRRIIRIPFTLLLLTISSIFYVRCTAGGYRLKVQNYRQTDTGMRILLVIQGQYFGELGETEVLINGENLDPSHFFKWNDNEIQLFIRKPFTYAQIQLKREKQSSRLIPVWNPDYLPIIQHAAQMQDFPVLENFQMLSKQPPILEIQGQNLGLRYTGQLLLFSRKQNSSIYFEPSQFESFRPLQEAEPLFWSNQTIRMLLPQDVIGGPVFLLRYNNDGKLLSSNSLYLPDTENSNLALPSTNAQAPEQVLRLVLQYPPNIIPAPQLYSAVKTANQAVNPKAGQELQQAEATTNSPLDYNSLVAALLEADKQRAENPEDQDSSKQQETIEISLAWPRNQTGQSWLNLGPEAAFANPFSYTTANAQNDSSPSSAENKEEYQQTKAQQMLLLPARSVRISSIPEKVAQQFTLAGPSYLLQPSSSIIAMPALQQDSLFPTQSLYLLLRLTTGAQKLSTQSRNQNYKKAELAQFRHTFQNNAVMILEYQVPHWINSDTITRNSRLSPYRKAINLYEQAIQEWKIRNFQPQETLASSIWLSKDRLQSPYALSAKLRSWPTDSQKSIHRLASSTEQTIELYAEQVLLLLLRSFNQQDIPTRIIAGAIASSSVQNSNSHSSLLPYYWLELYLPDYGWFPLDPIAEIIQYQQNLSNPAKQRTNLNTQFWGSLYSQENTRLGNPRTLSKLAFFPLTQEWQSFDNALLPTKNHDYPVSWSLQRLQ